MELLTEKPILSSVFGKVQNNLWTCRARIYMTDLSDQKEMLGGERNKPQKSSMYTLSCCSYWFKFEHEYEKEDARRHKNIYEYV